MEASAELISLCKEAIESFKRTDVSCNLILNPLLRNGIGTIEDFERISAESIKHFRTIGDGKMIFIYKMRELLGLENAPFAETSNNTFSGRAKWNYISKVGNPPKEKYDWVLIKTDFDNGSCLPHIAELRDGKWFATDIDCGPIEEVLGCNVIAWADMQLIK